MLSETKFKFFLVISILILLWEAVMWNNDIITINTQKQTIDSLSKANDSLHDELFIKSTEVGRYELSVEHLKEVNPKAAKELTDYLEHETE